MHSVERELQKVKASEQRAWMKVSHALSWNNVSELESATRWLIKLDLHKRVLGDLAQSLKNKGVM